MSLPARRGLPRQVVTNITVDTTKKRKLEQLGEDWASMELVVPQASSPRRGRSAGLQTPPLTPTRRILSPWNKKAELAALAEALKAGAQDEANAIAEFASLLGESAPGDPLDHRLVGSLTKRLFDYAQQRLATLQALASCSLDCDSPRVENHVKPVPSLVTLAPLVLSVPQTLVAAHQPRALRARAVLVSDSQVLRGGQVALVDHGGLIVFDCLAVPAEVIAANDGAKSLRIHLEAIVDPSSATSIAQQISAPVTVPLPSPLSSPATSESSSPVPHHNLTSSVAHDVHDVDVTVSHDIFTSFSTTSTPSADERPRKRARTDSDASSPLVDITPLLPLPQKEAASRLGISESMLCKRFKECTQRKWPYRQLCKLDKAIAALLRSRKRGATAALVSDEAQLPPNDVAKLRALRKQREAILAPVQIRVTATADEAPATAPKKVPRASSRQSRGSGRFGADFLQEDVSSQVEDDMDCDDGDEDDDDGPVREFEVQWEIHRDDDDDDKPPTKRGAKSRRIHDMDKIELAELEDDAAVVVLSLLSQGAML